MLHIFRILGCVLCVVGSTTIVLHAFQERQIESVTEVLGLAIKPRHECQSNWYCFEAYFTKNESITIPSNMAFYLHCFALSHHLNELFKQGWVWLPTTAGSRNEALCQKWREEILTDSKYLRKVGFYRLI